MPAALPHPRSAVTGRYGRPMSRLLLVHHAPTAVVAELADRVEAGAHDEEVTGVEVVVRDALSAGPEDVLAADGLVLGTPANFGYMSGALKHFFDSVFLEVGGSLSDDGSAASGAGASTPFGLWVHGRYDTTGATRSVLTITGALPWRPAAAVLEVVGDVDRRARDAAYELGATLAALVSPDA